ncbi:MAG: cytochrome c3 family protein [Gemmatimonadetes bacterium]|nr:cytochrome c3 family protein [Gemmatimonadota bacterium]
MTGTAQDARPRRAGYEAMKRRSILISIVGLAAAVAFLTLFATRWIGDVSGEQAAQAPADTAGAAAAAAGPQPIPFPHTVHAGQYRIDCQYCHYSAERSVDAGLPSMATCMGCHQFVGRNLPGVQQLTQYWEAGEPIPWVRIYKIPDHAHFPHMRHIAAELECSECHGAVEEMTVVTLNQRLTMGWCVSCHREREARTDCAVCHY